MLIAKFFRRKFVILANRRQVRFIAHNQYWDFGALKVILKKIFSYLKKKLNKYQINFSDVFERLRIGNVEY